MTDVEKKPEPPTEPDVGGLVRGFLKVWKERVAAEVASRETDRKFREAQEAVSTAFPSMCGCLPEGGPVRRAFACDGWIVTVEKVGLVGVLSVTAVEAPTVEPV